MAGNEVMQRPSTQIKSAGLSKKQLASQRVKALIGLQAKLWWRSLRANTAGMIFSVFVLLYGAGFMFVGAFAGFGLVAESTMPEALGALCALGTLGYLFLGLMLAAAEGRFIPEQYSFLPLRTKDIKVPALVCSLFQVRAVIAILITFATTWGGCFGLASAGKALWIIAFLPAMAATLVFTILLGEVFALFSMSFASRGSREKRGLISFLGFMALTIVFGCWSFWMQRVEESGGDFGFAMQVLNVLVVIGAWTLGALVAGIINLAFSVTLVGVAQVLIGCALLVAVVVAWQRLLMRSLVEPIRESVSKKKKKRSPVGVPLLLRGLPWGAGPMILSRSLRYFIRDTRLLMSIILYPLLLVYVVFMPSNGMELFFLLLFTVTPALLGSNDFGYDGPSNWLHISSPLPAKTLVFFRHCASILPSLALFVSGFTVCLIFSPKRDVIAELLVLYVGVFLGSAGVGVLLSAFNPYPMARPGTNPWKDKSGFSGGAFIASMASMFGSLLPILAGGICFLIGFLNGNQTLKIVGGVLALVIPLILYVFLLRAAVKRVENHYPEIFAKVRNYV